MKAAKNLKLWATPSHYYGAEYPEYYVCATQTRDSHCLDRANFDATLKAIGESKYTNAVIVARASHWLCGWVEVLLVHRGASKKIAIADQIAAALQNYPVVDENLYSQYENEEKESIWAQMDLRERMQLCVRAGLSCLAARHDYIPSDVDQYIEV